MKTLNVNELNLVAGGYGYHPGYNADDTTRAFGAIAGFFGGIVSGIWNGLDELANG